MIGKKKKKKQRGGKNSRENYKKQRQQNNYKRKRLDKEFNKERPLIKVSLNNYLVNLLFFI